MKPGKKNLEKATAKTEDMKRTLDADQAEQVKGGKATFHDLSAKKVDLSNLSIKK